MGMSLLSPLLLLAVTGAVHGKWGNELDNEWGNKDHVTFQDNFNKTHSGTSMLIYRRPFPVLIVLPHYVDCALAY